MKYYTPKELQDARDVARKHKTLGISFLQITLGIGYEKAGVIYSELKKDNEFKDYPRNYSFKYSSKSKNFVSPQKLNLSERLFDLFDDEIGRESVKLCIGILMKNKSKNINLINQLQIKFGTGYARSAANVHTARLLYKEITEKKIYQRTKKVHSR